MLRVIAGEARSVPLVTVEGEATRPTTDRIKETLFNILQGDIPECRFLDLFAGSGQMGIEALSRGAAHACLVESDAKASACIDQNLKKTKLIDRAMLLKGAIPSILRRLEGEEAYDIVFIDPPYAKKECYTDALLAIKEYGIISKDSIIICEADCRSDMSFVDDLGYIIDREKEYKSNKHVFLSMKEV